MMPLYADTMKYNLHSQNDRCGFLGDAALDSGCLGVIVSPRMGCVWNQSCENAYRQIGATGINLYDIGQAPGGSLKFINALPNCRSVSVAGGSRGIDLSPLAGNECIEDIRVEQFSKVGEFDLSSLPNLRRCHIPLIPEVRSFLKCRKLISLWLDSGKYDGFLDLSEFDSLKEFKCGLVKKISGVRFNQKVRLLALGLFLMKDFEYIEPLNAVYDELRVIDLAKVPKFGINWLSKAKKAECVSLALKLKSLRFLGELPKLQVLCLFGSKVADKDFSVRDALNNKLDPYLWGTGEKVMGFTEPSLSLPAER